MKCKFCNIDKSKIENTIIDETNNFLITPALGSLVEGYLLIISKKHINSMSNLDDKEVDEYIELINKYRNVFKKVYNRYPIIFEHGTPVMNSAVKASSVVHAHTHIVNHNYLNEDDIIKNLNFKKIDKLSDIAKNKNYIAYINPMNEYFVTYNFESVSQMMRMLIAKDLNIENKYDWKKNPMIKNVELTVNTLTNNNSKGKLLKKVDILYKLNKKSLQEQE